MLKKALKKWGDLANEREIFKLREISLLETANLNKGLGSSKSFGHEGLDAMAIKLAANSLLKPINFLINLSIRKQEFATHWKIGRLIPLFKGKRLAKTDPYNYRPISLLPVTSKLLERAVQNQLLEFMIQSKQLNRNQNAYLRNHSTTTTLLQLTEQLYTATDEKLISVMMTIDESCAFDSVDHDLLLQKMLLYNFSENTVKWFRNYLVDRTNYVTHNAKDSIMKKVPKGVPQGSVLGPILYTIFINDLPELIKDDVNCKNHAHNKDDFLFGPNCESCGSIPCYADDATVVVSSKTRGENQEKIVNNLQTINSFLNNNGLIVNNEKTTLTEIMTAQKRTRTEGDPPKLTVVDKKGNDKTVVPENYTRLLGCNVSRNLRWSEHLISGDKAVLPTIRKKIGALKLLSNKLPMKSRQTLANGFVLSNLNYAIQIWGAADKKPN